MRIACMLFVICTLIYPSTLVAAVQKDDPSYAGTQVCGTCHAQELRDWQDSHHDLAMQEATDQSVLGDFSGSSLTHFGVTSTFFRRDGGFWVSTDGPEGAMQDFEIAYTYGVDPLQQYLIRFPGGRLQTLGIAWDSRPEQAGGQRWFHLNPDEAIPAGDVLHWTGRFQNWNVMCASCHSTNVEIGYDPASDSYESTWTEINVGCEACHGPGAEHVSWARAAPPPGDAAAMPDDPKDLRSRIIDYLADDTEGHWQMDAGRDTASWQGPPRDQSELETCAACHARRRPLVDGWEAGDGFHDTHALALLDQGLYHADGQIQDEVYVYGSFLQSKMFHAGVVCSDCHNPHSLKLKAPGNEVCGQCHMPETFDTAAHHYHPDGSAGAQCANCHMPETTYMVVDPRRDHSIRVPRPDMSVALGTPNACTGCHEDKSNEWAASTVAEWYGPGRRQESHFAAALHTGRTGAPGAEAQLTATVLDPKAPTIARATALSLLPPYANRNSLPAYRAGLNADDPLLRQAALRAMTVFPAAERMRLAGPLLDDPVRAVRTEAARLLAGLPESAFTPEQLSKFSRAANEYVAAQTLLGHWPQSHVNLGLFYADRGDVERADAAYQAALDRDPNFVPAYLNRADLARALGDETAALGILQKGLEAVPDAAALHHTLGLTLIRSGKQPLALAALQRAAELAPDDPRYAYVFSIALNSTGKAAEALATLRTAHEQHPYDTDILLALTTISRDWGDMANALAYAQKLAILRPDDPQVQQLLSALQKIQSMQRR